MKFGKEYAQQLAQWGDWRAHAVAYKQLKRLLKACVGVSRHQKLDAATFDRCHAAIDPKSRTDGALRASRPEAAFFRAVRNEIDKVNLFFLSEQQAVETRVRAFEQQLLHDVRNHTTSTIPTQNGFSIDEWMRRCGQLYAEQLALEQFCVLNFCAVAKILKKHDKWTAFATRMRFERAVLVKQPFATYVPLLQMMQRVEAVAVQLSVLQLSSSPSLEASDAARAIILATETPRCGLRIESYKSSSEDDDYSFTDQEDISPRGPGESTTAANEQRQLPEWRRLSQLHPANQAVTKRRRTEN